MSVATNFVRRIIQEQGPLTGKEIYRIVKATPFSAASSLDERPHPHHGHELLVPSVSYLKNHVLKELKNEPSIQLKHTRRPVGATSSSTSSTSTTSPTDPKSPKAEIAAGTPTYSAWEWRVTPPAELPARIASLAPKPKGKKTARDPLHYDAANDRVFMTRLPSIDHLNWRRQKARVPKDIAERVQAKALEHERRRAAKEGRQLGQTE
ncbi:hypothetical protein DL93DRAFT_2162974 [Clavulina sp. PMI_390]|nr:hypothetical protein DL93DRAFT_2162974 [Clavulina sp. PMI_390]